jgi:hypothetical protein
MFGPPGAANAWRAAWLFILARCLGLAGYTMLPLAIAGTCSLLLRTRLPFLYSSESVGILALLACQALLSVGCVCVICLRLESAQCALWQRVCRMCCCVLWRQAGCDTHCRDGRREVFVVIQQQGVFAWRMRSVRHTTCVGQLRCHVWRL